MDLPAMPPVTIYTTRYCPYCTSAKSLLAKKNVTFQEIDVTGDPAGRTTVPQIFIGARHVGGCDDLYDLNETGQLDPLLAV